jgi:hypothetical protein
VEAHYESLLEKIGPFWPQMPKAYTPRSKSHPDWAAAEQLYDSAQSLIEGGQEHAGPDLEEAFNDWFLNLPDWYQQMIAERFERVLTCRSDARERSSGHPKCDPITRRQGSCHFTINVRCGLTRVPRR